MQAINFVVGNYKPKQRNIFDAVEKVKNELKEAPFHFEFILVRSKVNRIVDNSAKKYYKKRDAEISARINKRIASVLKLKERGQCLECKNQSNQIFHVKSSSSDIWYTVNLKNLSCTCPYWTSNWSGKNIPTILTRALPCKHMCRATEFGGLNIFDIFRSQIFRRN